MANLYWSIDRQILLTNKKIVIYIVFFIDNQHNHQQSFSIGNYVGLYQNQRKIHIYNR